MASSFPAAAEAARLADALPPGARVHGEKYVVGQVLGRGGFGITYRGRDQHLHRDVAIKEFFPYGCARSADHCSVETSSQDFQNGRAAFADEARHLANFDAPGIVRVYEIFEANATTYIAMEFLAGPTLAAFVETHGALSAADTLAVAEKIGAALRVLHADQFIHRDLKPDNIIVCSEQTSGFAALRLALIDFGLARRLATSPYATQQIALNAGTEGFAPPEQYSLSADVGAFSDIYALAATLYFCLTAQAPPSAPARASTPSLRALPAVDAFMARPIASAIERAMSLPTSERPQSVDEFLATLRAPHRALENAAPTGAKVLASGEAEVKVGARVLSWPHLCRCCNAPLSSQPAGMQRRRRFWCTREDISDWREENSNSFCDACQAHWRAQIRAIEKSVLASRGESEVKNARGDLNAQINLRREHARRESENILNAPSTDATLTLTVGMLVLFSATILSGVLITGFLFAGASVVVFEIGRTLAFGKEDDHRARAAAQVQTEAENEVAALIAERQKLIADLDAATRRAREEAAQESDAAKGSRGANCSCGTGAVRIEDIAASQHRVIFTNPHYADAFARVNADQLLH